ncbi:MAG: serine/threonine-protein kinase PknK [Deltaproteobacteria bacterium]|nr:MAG: serine/threonine-protein kinase PknK [Deltaproteobacteria bacterium]
MRAFYHSPAGSGARGPRDRVCHFDNMARQTTVLTATFRNPRYDRGVQQRFEVVRRLGAGAVGVVHEAIDRETGARVAVKTLRTDDPYLLVRFKNEFRAIQALRHPNLVQLGELVESDGRWAFSMELVDGVDFLEWVRPRRAGTTFDEERLRDALAQLARALIAVHDAGKVHRDIKPSNILVEPNGRVVLLDFGFVSAVTGDPDLEPGWTVGTPDYMAPEQARGRTAGPAADWYAVGTLLYQALTHVLPFSGTSTQVMMDKQHREPPPPSVLVRGVPPDLDELCVDLLRVAPSQRPTGREVLRRLGVRAELPAPAADDSNELFVGRARELARLWDVYRGGRGAATAVVVAGESGVGKSALVREFVRQVRRAEQDAIVLGGHCYERESVPFKAADELVDAITRYLMTLPETEVAAVAPRDAALLSRVFPVLRRLPAFARMADEVAGPADPTVQRARLFAALRELVAQIARRAPTLLVVEDLQWADADSRALLRALMEDGPPPVLLLATAHAASEPPLDGAVVLALEPLPVEDARTLAVGLGAADDADAIAAAAAGLPLFVEELVRRARAGGGVGAAHDLAALIQERLASLPLGARHILEIVSVAGAPVAHHVVAHAAGMDFAAYLQRVASLRAARMVRTSGVRRGDQIAPVHDAVRAAVVGSLARQVRAGVHEALALALEARGTRDDEALAVHWRAAGYRDKARVYTVRAARRAREAFAFARAAALFRDALDLDPSPAERRALWAEFGDALAAAGRAGEAADAYLEAVAGTPAGDTDALELQRRAADQLLRSGRVDAGLAALSHVLAAVGLELPSYSRRALARALLGRWRPRSRFRRRGADELSARELLRVDACWTGAMGIVAIDSRLTPLFQALHTREALRAGEPVRVARALTVDAVYDALRGAPPSRLARRVHTVEDLAAQTGDSYVRGLAAIARASAAVFPGDWRTGLDMAERAEGIFRDECVGVAREISIAQQFNSMARFYLGELRAADALLSAGLRHAQEIGDLYSASTLRLGIRNAQWLARDDVAAARFHLEEALRDWPDESFYLQHYMGAFARANLELYVGDAVAALAAVEDAWEPARRALVLRAQFARINLRFARARAALAAGGAAAAARVAADARALRREGPAYAAAYAALLAAGVAEAEGHAVRAARGYARVAERFAALGMRPFEWCARFAAGRALGGAEGDERRLRAAGELRELGVAAPEAFTAIWAPPPAR